MAALDNTISYIEFAATDVAKAKLFYETVFGWSFVDYGPDYSSFDNNTAGIDGGFYKSEAHDPQPKTAPLVVLYSSDLDKVQGAIVAAGGSIVVPTFDFPGGKRFHFDDSVGNVLAVWSE
jgi:predicted enzyme related to lactoylglutathione lyase